MCRGAEALHESAYPVAAARGRRRPKGRETPSASQHSRSISPFVTSSLFASHDHQHPPSQIPSTTHTQSHLSSLVRSNHRSFVLRCTRVTRVRRAVAPVSAAFPRASPQAPPRAPNPPPAHRRWTNVFRPLPPHRDIQRVLPPPFQTWNSSTASRPIGPTPSTALRDRSVRRRVNA